MLSAFVGIEIISKVPSILHTPLMGGSNAIHGVIIVGAMIILGSATTTAEDILGFLAVILATLNVVGGFVVTDRMLELFKSKSPTARAEEVGGRAVSRGTLLELIYLVAATTFLIALKALGSPKRARQGNFVAIWGHGSSPSEPLSSIATARDTDFVTFR
jgi:NAD(P) transhydrogenase subunit alpha